MSKEKRRRKRGMDRKKVSCPKQRYMTDRLIGTKIDTRILACANGERRVDRTVVEPSVVPNSRTDTSRTIDKKLISGVSIGVSLSRPTRVEIIMVSCIGVACVGSSQSRS